MHAWRLTFPEVQFILLTLFLQLACFFLNHKKRSILFLSLKHSMVPPCFFRGPISKSLGVMGGDSHADVIRTMVQWPAVHCVSDLSEASSLACDVQCLTYRLDKLFHNCIHVAFSWNILSHSNWQSKSSSNTFFILLIFHSCIISFKYSCLPL